jgi:hypothetical protein
MAQGRLDASRTAVEEMTTVRDAARAETAAPTAVGNDGEAAARPAWAARETVESRAWLVREPGLDAIGSTPSRPSGHSRQKARTKATR